MSIESGDPAVTAAGQRVDAGLARLGQLAGQPVASHVAVYEGISALLQDALADLDEESADSGSREFRAGGQSRPQGPARR